MSWQFPANPYVPLSRFKTVNRADVIKTAAGHITAGRCVSTRHHPRGTQWYGVHFVGRVTVPYDKFTVLWRGNKIPRVWSPVHGVDFRQVTPEGATRPHLHPADRFQSRRRLDQGCVACRFSGILELETKT